ncbi:MFS transporter [Salmonella enterica subsp. enterica serovar Java]|uniref:MFS transporter n=4 Tax=Salmonella enterica TaxID=28901 RepID=A0A3R0UZ20_SALER|nr:MFS transporter [Salmonella enterica subsp. enterica serovar Aqua]EDU0621597.1 MFS transporter [Salmonella enterica subsp. enterica serovar Java]EJA5030374.1 MFS transporter [Salmonella enterica]HBM0103100.1 MFS transporter [Salmonella enterica subsp. enterica serovar Wedding]ECH1168682.1 MFS transporter [Salmonella enterica subsp. enterica serovar Aqua]
MKKWIIEFVLYAVYMVFGAAWATTGSVMPQIMTDFNVDVSHAALMSNVILWAKIVGAVCTALLVTRLGTRKSYLLGCAMIGVSIFIPFTDNFMLLLVIRFVGGLGGAVCLVSLVPTVARFFDNRMASTLNSINCTSNIVGTIIALTLAGYLSTLFGGWRNLLAGYGAVTLVLGVIWILCFSDEDSPRQADVNIRHKDKLHVLKEVIFSRIVWGMIAQYAGAMIMMVFMFTFLPLYYAKYASLSADSHAHLSGTVNQVGIMLGALVGPYFKNRKYHYKSWLFVSSIFMAVTTFAMLFATNDFVILACSFLTGSIFATWFAFIFSIPKEELKEATTQIVTWAMSTFWVCTFVLATINSQLIGWSVDLTGGFTVGFTYVFALMVISPVVALIIFPKEIVKEEPRTK